MLYRVMESKLLSTDVELENDWLKGLEMGELNDAEKLLYRSFTILKTVMSLSRIKSL